MDRKYKRGLSAYYTPDCNIQDVQKSFAVDLKPLVNNFSISENQRKELLEHYKKKFSFEKGFQGLQLIR